MRFSNVFFSFRSLLLTLFLASAVVVPAQAEMAGSDAASKQVATQAAAAQSDKININTADAQSLADRLNGVGQKKAEAIVTYRNEHGPFKTLEDLVNVPGIGEATIAKNRDILSIN